MSDRPGIDANTAIRVPSTMRAWPVCAASQLDRRCAGVMPLCIDTTASAPNTGAKRSVKRACSWGVRLISGTITSTWAVGLLANTCATQRKYTSVLPLPVLPKSNAGEGAAPDETDEANCAVGAAAPAAPAVTANCFEGEKNCLIASLCCSLKGGRAAVSARSAGGSTWWGLPMSNVAVLARRLACAACLRASCWASSSRSWGGSAATATSPIPRW